MSLLDLLLNRKNVTYDWVKRPGLPLVVDLDRHSLCGVAVGAAIAGLAGLGPADDRRHQGAVLGYGRGGFYLTYDRRLATLTGFVLGLTTGSGAARPYAGTWRWRGREVMLSASTSPQRLTELLGEEPFHDFRDEVTGELVRFYEHPAAEWQFVFDAQSHLTSVEILKDAELKDPASRASYGCSKPWALGT
jgi:hypothetical protein